MPDQCVQTCVTSPPYWGLRDYGVAGQLGLEKTPEEYCEKMTEVFREVRRVLRDDGTLWLNLGDGYARDSAKGEKFRNGKGHRWSGQNPNGMRGPGLGGLKPKDLVGIPWRVAFALQADGWYLRSDIIWSKPNPMPESVTDRPTKAHEYVFLMTKSARYYYDAEAIKERSIWGDPRKPYAPGQSDARGDGHARGGGKIRPSVARGDCVEGFRNKRTVWEISTQPYPEAHFATFPEAVVQPCIMAGTSEKGSCSKCGAPWIREVESRLVKSPVHGAGSVVGRRQKSGQNNFDGAGMPRMNRETKTVGWQPSCSCAAGVDPCMVLDPFLGSGTVALVALKARRRYIGIELNPKYVELAKKRIEQERIQSRLL